MPLYLFLIVLVDDLTDDLIKFKALLLETGENRIVLLYGEVRVYYLILSFGFMMEVHLLLLSDN